MPNRNSIRNVGAVSGICLVTVVLVALEVIPAVFGSQQDQTSKCDSGSTLLGSKNCQDVQGMRRHAWDLFVAITKPSAGDSDTPAWDTWDDKAQIFTKQPLPKMGSMRQRQIDLPFEILASYFAASPGAENTAVKGAVDYVRKNRDAGFEVLYNPIAAKHIRDHKLSDQAALQSQWQSLKDLNSPISETSIPPFPESSIVVKAMWLKVGPTSPEILSAWRGPKIAVRGCEYGCSEDVTVKLASPGEECNLSNRSAEEPILSSCFYTVPTGNDGYRLLLFGLHVATKEVEDWTWTTFWWQLDPDSGPYHEGRPPATALKDFWRNYVMNTTLSMATPEEPPRSSVPIPQQRCQIVQSTTAKICFNPYLELGVVLNGALSNCMNCHRQATYPVMTPDPRGTAQRGYLSSDDPCFGESTVAPKRGRVMKLDYMWSLSPLDKNSGLGKFVHQVQTQLDAK